MDENPRTAIGRLAQRITRTQEQDDADALQRGTTRYGATAICDLQDREVAVVCGLVRSVTLRPRTNVPALVAELYDGSTVLNLVWLGRRKIRGIEPGTYLKVTGRVTHRNGVPVVFNPAYEIVPSLVR